MVVNDPGVVAADQCDVKLETSMGDIEIELYWKEAPLACENFAGLARRQFYDGVPFHRVCKEFVIQGDGFFSGDNRLNGNRW
jgi:cyclophilin family peptidyl-prolyl cis-trans isomerase